MKENKEIPVEQLAYEQALAAVHRRYSEAAGDGEAA